MTIVMIIYMLGAGIWSIGALAWPDEEALSSMYVGWFASLAVLAAAIMFGMALWTGVAA